MATFEPFSVIAAPFPYVERPVTKRRPCLVIGQPEDAGLVWVLMITSAKNRPWAGDIEISDLDAAGLKSPSVVRTAKISTVEADVIKMIGRLDAESIKAVGKMLKRHQGW